MSNPWLSIPPSEYDEHLAHPAVRQREFLDQVFCGALAEYTPSSVALLGCATGGGLENVDFKTTSRVTAVDLNPAFIDITRSRLASHLPQLELIEADLESCELDAGAYDLIHCALVLEYVDPDVVLAKIARWLSPNGVLVVVLQLHSPEAKAVTETGCESLKLLEPLMKLHEPDDIRQRAAMVKLSEAKSTVERLETGKEFYIGHFRFDERQQVGRWQ